MSSFRHKLGAIVYDWPRFLVAIRRDGGWPKFRNRYERITIDPRSGGVRCEWRFTSDLHLPKVFPRAGNQLMHAALGQWPIELRETPRTSGEPLATFVIGHRGESRLPLLLTTLRSIAAQDIAVECIVVEQSAQQVAAGHLPKWVRYLYTPISSDELPYNRSSTLNAGAKAARTQLLILHDNDFLVPVSYASELVTRHKEGWEFIDLKRFMFYLTQEASARAIQSMRIELPLDVEYITQNLCAGGSVAADRDAYFAIGGFDESFVGWGGEDNDFWERASTRRVFSFAYLPLLHLWHSPQREKLDAEAAAGRVRFRELEKTSPLERIKALKQGTTEQKDSP